MRLLTKTTLYFLIVLVLLLAGAGFYLFHQFSKEINYRSDRELVSSEIEWIQYLQSETANGSTFILRSPDLAIFPTDAAVMDFPRLTDISFYSKKVNEIIPYRQLLQVIPVHGIPYQIMIRQSQEQKAALVTGLTRMMLYVFAGLFAATLIFNWAISNSLWRPFRDSLRKIRSAELQKMESIRFENTSTQEFNELNASLNFMTRKMYRDYLNMKEFTENAAHEMQTPVAVVQSKLELLLQDDNLKDEQVQAIVQSATALNRLSKLNEGLLFLAKIGNNQYESTEAVSLAKITKKYLELFHEFTKEMELTVTTTFDDPFNVAMHPVLADSLISNLLGNAIKYNYHGGNINIIVSAKSYRVSNSGMLKPIDPGTLYTRLHKAKGTEENSNGLGLAIVKKIIDANNLLISYAAENGVHQFTITKSEKNTTGA